ncbi:DUF1499 domain-containing protein [Dokdonella sp.]|uniref:DUF1499 domain-containing protein n=1 Tax=Dokdonella sp. TaxID=2291710 RepID=UPI0031C743DC|nr:DUF1499 domain-containing protein [Dokdonella sp.]
MISKPAGTRSGRSASWARAVTWAGLVLGILALLGMLLAGPLYRFGVLGLGPAFRLMGLGAKAGSVAIVIALLGLVLALFARRGRLAVLALLGLVLGALAFVPPWMFRHAASQVPPIHDISTDTDNPPEFVAILPLRADAPNAAAYAGAAVAAQQHQAYPDIQPLQLKAAPAAVFDAALKAGKAMGWDIVAEDPAQGRIEATATTFWFGFKDDVVIRIRPNAQGTRLDIRSESRVGKSDVGKNAARIRAFRDRLETSLAQA